MNTGPGHSFVIKLVLGRQEVEVAEGAECFFFAKIQDWSAAGENEKSWVLLIDVLKIEGVTGEDKDVGNLLDSWDETCINMKNEERALGSRHKEREKDDRWSWYRP